MDDHRLGWFKEVIYKALSIDFTDSAFQDLLKQDYPNECFQNLISSAKDTPTSIFIYCTVEEEEVEVEDTYEHTTESEKFGHSESSASEKSESDNASIDDKTEVDDADNHVKVDSPVEDSESHTEAGSRKSSVKSRKSTTSLLQIVKKNVLHVCLNITKYTADQRYVYFLNRKNEPVPPLASMEEALYVMPDYFEFGSINQHPLLSMNKVVSHIYAPILENKEWMTIVPPSECQLDTKQLSVAFNDFHKDMKEFLKTTEETVSQIEKPFMFNVPNIIINYNVEELSQERSFVAEAEELVSEWTDMLSDLLNIARRKKPPENDLLGEINFWRKQKFSLSTCYDHLSQKSIQQTTEILKLAESDIEEFDTKVKEVEKYFELATDNFNYLSLLEPIAKNLLPDKSFEESKKAVEDIFMMLRLIWIQSNYYKEISNMCRIIKGVAVLLKDKVKHNANVETLYRKGLPEIHKIVISSSKLLQFWKDQYLKESESVKKYGGLYWWGFDIKAFFDETDHMILVCSDLEKVTVMLEQLFNIFNTNLKYFVQDVKGLDVLRIRVFGIASRIQYANFDIFDAANKIEWKKIMDTFLRDVKNYEDEIKLYISKMFRTTLTWESADILTKSFSKFAISSSIQNFIDQSRDDMLKRFIREIYEKENEFLSYKEEPPHLPGIPRNVSNILWVQDLIRKLSEPILQICDHKRLSKREAEVQERFKKTEMLLVEYKKEKYEVWKISANELLNKFLQEKLLKKLEQVSARTDTRNFPPVLAYQVNFPINLEEVSMEAKLLEYYGYEIPSFVKNIVLQEDLYYKHRHEFRINIENLKNCVATLNDDEISILGLPIENLCSVLDLGVYNIQWESSEIFDFVKKVKRAVDIFRSLVSQIQNVFVEIDNRIEALAYCDLFEFKECDTQNMQTCEEFFSEAEEKMDIKVGKIIDIYASLELLLTHLEKITCKTSTGEAIQMRQYYQKCEEKILKSLIKMTIANLEYLKDELLENYIFPYIEAASQSEIELIKSSLARADLIFVTFIQNAVESSRKIIRWLDGTCLKSSPFQLPETKEQLEFSYYLDICMHPKIKSLVLNILNTFFVFTNKINNF